MPPSFLLMIHQSEHALGDHIQIDLARAALDGVTLGAQPRARYRELARLERGTFPTESLAAHCLHHQFGALLVYLRCGVLDDRGRRTRPFSLLRFLLGATNRQRKSASLHLVRANPCAQISVCDASTIRADVFERRVLDIVGTIAATAEAAGRNVLALILKEPLCDIPA